MVLEVLELKQILDSLGCIAIRMPRKYSDTQQNDFGALIIAHLVIIFVFKVILVIQ